MKIVPIKNNIKLNKINSNNSDSKRKVITKEN